MLLRNTPQNIATNIETFEKKFQKWLNTLQVDYFPRLISRSVVVLIQSVVFLLCPCFGIFFFFFFCVSDIAYVPQVSLPSLSAVSHQLFQWENPHSVVTMVTGRDSVNRFSLIRKVVWACLRMRVFLSDAWMRSGLPRWRDGFIDILSSSSAEGGHMVLTQKKNVLDYFYFT